MFCCSPTLISSTPWPWHIFSSQNECIKRKDPYLYPKARKRYQAKVKDFSKLGTERPKTYHWKMIVHATLWIFWVRLSVQVTLSTITDLFALHCHDTVETSASRFFLATSLTMTFAFAVSFNLLQKKVWRWRWWGRGGKECLRCIGTGRKSFGAPGESVPLAQWVR